MKITKSQLKELIRKKLTELEFDDEEAFKKYKAKHKMRGTTKVNIGGKDTTVDKASGDKKDIDPKIDKQMSKAADDANAKMDAAEKAAKKDTKSASDNAQDFLTGKNAEANIDKLNDLAMDDEPVQFDTDSGQSLTWDDGDYETNVVYALDQDGGEVVVDFSDIVRMDMDLPKADRGNKALFSDPEPEDDTGGPSYANVPKGAKSTKQANLMKKNDSAAKDLGYKNTEDLAMDGYADDLGEFLDSIPDEGQNFNEADEMINYIRDNEMGMREDDDDTVEAYRKVFLSMVNKPSEKGGSGKSGKDIEKQSMKAADDANAKMDKAEKLQGEIEGLKQALSKEDDPNSMRAKSFRKSIKSVEDELKQLHSESIKESKGKRITVKEIKKWMKTLEENRYKKTYNSDCRRVSWMVNHMGENVENMPISMRKKWTKAQYGRERYLAKEYMKHLESKQLSEMKLRRTIRNIIKEVKNGTKKTR